MPKELNVYISSTSKDLSKHRREIISALRQMTGIRIVCMEDYTAQDILPVEKCLDDVASCDVYVGLFAWRYGYIPQDRNPGCYSITELEYQKAEEKKKTILIFLLKDDCKWPKKRRDDGENGQKIKRLRQHLADSRLVGFFTSPEKLINALLPALYNHIHKQHKNYRPIPLPLPVLQPNFVDREAEQEMVLQELSSGEKRMIMIIAPAGFGKTELTTKILSRLTDKEGAYPVNPHIQGILYLSCAQGQVNLGTVFSQIGIMLGEEERFRNLYTDKDKPLHIKIGSLLGEARTAGNIWIVLDQFEDMMNAGDDAISDPEMKLFLEQVLGVQNSLRIIITTRLMPLFDSKAKNFVKEINLDEGLPPDEAVRYLQIAGADYGLDREQENLLRDFSHSVYYIPKALESLVGYVAEQSPEPVSIEMLLTDKELFAGFAYRDKKEGLTKLIEKQVSLLCETRQRIIVMLTVFNRPVPANALKSLLPDMKPAEVHDHIRSLMKCRLIHYINDKNNQPLYYLLPLISAYIERMGDVLTRKRDGESIQIMHKSAAEYYQKIKPARETWKTITDLEPTLSEIYHLTAADALNEATDTLIDCSRGYLLLWGENQRLLQAGALLVDPLNDLHRLARLCLIMGIARQNLGETGTAIQRFEQGLEAARQARDDGLAGECMVEMSVSYYQRKEFDRMKILIEEALPLCRASGNTAAEGMAMGNLGGFYYARKEYRQAIDYFQQSYTIAVTLGEYDNQWRGLGNMGNAHRELNEKDMAETLFRQALVLCREKGIIVGEMFQRVNIAKLQASDHKLDRAAEDLNAAILLARQIGDPYHEGIWNGNLGNVYYGLNDVEKAVECLTRARDLAAAVGDREYETLWNSQLAKVKEITIKAPQ